MQSFQAQELLLHCLSWPQEALSTLQTHFSRKGCDRQDASNTGVSISPILTSEGSGKVKIIITIYMKITKYKMGRQLYLYNIHIKGNF